MVGDPFHLAQALVPTEGAKDLGHAAPLLFWVEACGRRAQLGKCVGKELHVPRAVEVAVAPVIDAGGKLVDDNVDARHILSGDRAEVVPGALAQARVAAFVLNHMPDVHNAVLTAPVADLLVKAGAVELRGNVHVGVTDSGAICLACPKAAQLGKPARAQRLVQAAGKLVRPRQCHISASNKAAGRSIVESRALLVHKARLIGKEPQDGAAELVAQVLKRGLVDGIDEHAARIGVDHVDVLIAKAGFLAGDVELDGGDAVGRVKTQASGGAVGLLNGELKVERCAGGVESRRAHKALRGIHKIAKLNDRGRLGTNDRNRAMLEHGLPKRGVDVLARKRAVGVARGEMGVVEQPDLQPQALALANDKTQVSPPAVATKLGMRARFEADLADVRTGNLLQVFGNRLVRLALEPQERKHMVVVCRHIHSSKTNLLNRLKSEYAARAFLLISKSRQHMTESTIVMPWISHV